MATGRIMIMKNYRQSTLVKKGKECDWLDCISRLMDCDSPYGLWKTIATNTINPVPPLFVKNCTADVIAPTSASPCQCCRRSSLPGTGPASTTSFPTRIAMMSVPTFTVCPWRAHRTRRTASRSASSSFMTPGCAVGSAALTWKNSPTRGMAGS